MKSIFIGILLFFSIFSFVEASTGDAPSSSGATESLSGQDLALNTVKILDDKHVRVVFAEPVEIESVTLKIVKQSDNSTINIATLTGVAGAPEAVEVTLEDTLNEATSYSITVIAAVGVSGSTITDGALAIQDFVTPSPLKKSVLVLSAPTNPTAVVAKTGSVTAPAKKPVETQKEEEKSPTPTEELPLTGMNPLYLLLIVLPFTYIFLRKRSH